MWKGFDWFRIKCRYFFEFLRLPFSIKILTGISEFFMFILICCLMRIKSAWKMWLCGLYMKSVPSFILNAELICAGQLIGWLLENNLCFHWTSNELINVIFSLYRQSTFLSSPLSDCRSYAWLLQIRLQFFILWTKKGICPFCSSFIQSFLWYFHQNCLQLHV